MRMKNHSSFEVRRLVAAVVRAPKESGDKSDKSPHSQFLRERRLLRGLRPPLLSSHSLQPRL